MSEFKVRVVTSRGSDSAVGYIDPAVGMVTQFGTIAAVEAATGICTMGDTAVHAHGGRQRFYAHQLQILLSDAPTYGWPNTGGSIRFGHQSEAAVNAAMIEHPKSHTYTGPDGKPRTETYA